MNIAIIGAGYVGIVTGSCFAHFGHKVAFIDSDHKRISLLTKGILPIVEPGLEDLFVRNFSRMRFITPVHDESPAEYRDDFRTFFANVEVIVICVGTPSSDSGAPDMTAFRGALRSLEPYLNANHVILIKSTVPPGTGDGVAAMYGDRVAGVYSNPEFLKEGDAVRDCIRPDRVVIGTGLRSSADGVVHELYRSFVRTEEQIFTMGRASAELTKYAANSMLAMRISFMNEMAYVADEHGANIDDVRRGIGSDSRIGSAFLYAGVGFGGSCMDKDLKALRSFSASSMHLVSATLKINHDQRENFVIDIVASLGPAREPRQRVAVWGLAFKPETDDVRDAPGVYVARELAKFYDVIVYDPVAAKNAYAVLEDCVKYATSAYQAADGADALILCTEWAEFRQPDFRFLSSTMKPNAHLFDGRNVWNRAAVEKLGFHYHGIGRPAAKAG
jgi:UDPglucose 6-dehydrogenase